MRTLNTVKTWLAEESESDASKKDSDDPKEDQARNGKKHPPFQNFRLIKKNRGLT